MYEMTEPICTHLSLVFGDEFLAQGLHLKSHKRLKVSVEDSSMVLSLHKEVVPAARLWHVRILQVVHRF